MIRRHVIVAALALAAAAPALASEEKSEAKGTGRYVDLAPVALPIVVDRKLVNYVFVYVRINLSRSADPTKLREKEPYFRDALVRAGHRTPFVNGDDYMSLDAAKLQAALKRDASAIVGARNIESVTILSQAPKKRVGKVLASRR